MPIPLGTIWPDAVVTSVDYAHSKTVPFTARGIRSAMRALDITDALVVIEDIEEYRRYQLGADGVLAYRRLPWTG